MNLSTSHTNTTTVDSVSDLADEDFNDHADDQLTSTLTIIMDTSLITMMVLMMLSFGCSLELHHIRHHLSRPINVVLSMLFHFVITPYVFYAIGQVVGLNEYDKVSLVVLATAPSGGIANLFVGHTDGDIALGIIIVAVSHVLALGFMPLNLWLFSRSWQSTVVVPYLQTIISLVTITIPVAVGMVILRRSDRVAAKISKVCSVVATVLVIGCIGLSSYMYPQMYSSSWSTWFICILFTPITFLIGYTIPFSMRMPEPIRRTLGITTSSKSMALCLTIIAMSFPENEYLKYLVFPELHSMFMVGELALFSLGYKLYSKCKSCKSISKPSVDST